MALRIEATDSRSAAANRSSRSSRSRSRRRGSPQPLQRCAKPMAHAGAGTRCNLSHCGWYRASGLQLARADPLAWSTRVRELRVTVQPADPKGLGVFAAQTAGPGRWVCSYAGELLKLSRPTLLNPIPTLTLALILL